MTEYRWRIRQRLNGNIQAIQYFRSKAALARHLGCSQSTIDNWANGRSRNTFHNILTIERCELPIDQCPSAFTIRKVVGSILGETGHF